MKTFGTKRLTSQKRRWSSAPRCSTRESRALLVGAEVHDLQRDDPGIAIR
jgi:hypothetical protein